MSESGSLLVRARYAFLSLAVMAPWPLLAYVLVQSQVERLDESVLLLGSWTGILMIPLILLGTAESTVEITIVTVWLLAWVLPWLLLGRERLGTGVVRIVIVAQALFASGQAALGALMILTKSV